MTLRSLPTVRTFALAAVLAVGAFLSLAGSALANASQISIMQDDRLFLNSGPAAQAAALNNLAQLGPHTIHSVVNWKNFAPSSGSTSKPAGFDGSNPANYPAINWTILDSLVRGAHAHGFGLQLSPAGPAPLWALKCSRSELHKYGKTKGTCKPDPKEYAAFVKALGTRYSGTYPDPLNPGQFLPRVTRWSIWNEPNLPSWLSPAIEKKGRSRIDVGGMVYRNLAYAALSGFAASGHSTSTHDTILLGETSPIGGSGANATDQEFYDAVFCVDTHLRRLRGKAAKQLGCKGRLKRMNVSGIAHHPYTRGAFRPLLDKQKAGNATIAYIPRLLHILRGGVRNGALSSSASKRLYWTEFGVASSPPASHGKGVSLAKQAEWINQMQFISYLSHNVLSTVQFQLSDDTGLVTAAKTTFQTGLQRSSGAPKPAFAAYRVPLYVVDLGHSLEVWGGSRLANGGSIQLQNNNKAFKTISLNRFGYFLTKIPKRGGSWRLMWTPPGGGAALFSRTAKPIKKSKAIASRH